MEELFVIGDVQGCLSSLDALLSNWNPDTQKLIFLGNLLGSGDNSLGVIKKARKLQEDHGAIVIGGSQELLFLEWLAKPNEKARFYYSKGGRETLTSFLGEDITKKLVPEAITEMLFQQYLDDILFIQQTPSFWEEQNHIMVHAGINLHLLDWKRTSLTQLRWGYDTFLTGRNKTGKRIVFGHFPTQKLNADQSHTPWISPCGTKIGLNGDILNGGCMLALGIKKDELRVYSAR